MALHDALGESHAIEAGTAIPKEWLVPGTLIGISGKPAIPLLIREVEAIADGGTRIVGSNLAANKRRVFTLAELEAIRPLYFVILPPHTWNRLKPFKEGAIYQAWPTGEIVQVKRRLLINPVTGGRITNLAAFPVLVERWAPPEAALLDGDEGV